MPVLDDNQKRRLAIGCWALIYGLEAPEGSVIPVSEGGLG